MLPDDWRTARVVPLHNEGDRNNASNYRPISLTSTSKVLEHIAVSDVIEYLEENSMFRNNTNFKSRSQL